MAQRGHQGADPQAFGATECSVSEDPTLLGADNLISPRAGIASGARSTELPMFSLVGLKFASSFRFTIHVDGLQMARLMAENIRELRPKPSDSEKITINLGYVDLGHIDLLVKEGFYSNRTDFIRTAIRNQLERHEDSVKQSVARHRLELGLRRYTRQDLEAVESAGERLHIQVLGLASIAEDVSPELALRTIASIHVLGALHLSATLRAALSDRIL
jgi:Arc/MetJ-type ribon-helix-helix transcriptional regulator